VEKGSDFESVEALSTDAELCGDIARHATHAQGMFAGEVGLGIDDFSDDHGQLLEIDQIDLLLAAGVDHVTDKVRNKITIENQPEGFGLRSRKEGINEIRGKEGAARAIDQGADLRDVEKKGVVGIIGGSTDIDPIRQIDEVGEAGNNRIDVALL